MLRALDTHFFKAAVEFDDKDKVKGILNKTLNDKKQTTGSMMKYKRSSMVIPIKEISELVKRCNYVIRRIRKEIIKVK